MTLINEEKNETKDHHIGASEPNYDRYHMINNVLWGTLKQEK